MGEDSAERGAAGYGVVGRGGGGILIGRTYDELTALTAGGGRLLAPTHNLSLKLDYFVLHHQ